MGGFLQVWFFVASLATWFLIDRFGRRQLFILGYTGFGECIFPNALQLLMYKPFISCRILLFGTDGNAATASWKSGRWYRCHDLYILGTRYAPNGLILIGTSNSRGVCGKGFFTWGLMANTWAYPSEILPLPLRTRGSAYTGRFDRRI